MELQTDSVHNDSQMKGNHMNIRLMTMDDYDRVYALWMSCKNMGFNDKDFRQIKKANVQYHKGNYLFSRDKIIRMAGNSIPVKLLEGMFWLLLETDRFIEGYKDGCT